MLGKKSKWRRRRRQRVTGSLQLSDLALCSTSRMAALLVSTDSPAGNRFSWSLSYCMQCNSVCIISWIFLVFQSQSWLDVMLFASKELLVMVTQIWQERGKSLLLSWKWTRLLVVRGGTQVIPLLWTVACLQSLSSDLRMFNRKRGEHPCQIKTMSSDKNSQLQEKNRCYRGKELYPIR